MSMTKLMKTETITGEGTGRRDYSANVEYIVEPLIRSYQSSYTLKIDFTDIPSGTPQIQDTSLTSGKVYMLYDFHVSAPTNSLFRCTIRVVSATGTTALIIHRWSYGSFSHNIPRGFPISNALRVAITNYSSETQSYVFSCSGLETDETIYLLTSDTSKMIIPYIPPI